jgi:DNA-directed RNA polymerase sigma subunit (sigma70/sigma32)
MMDRELLRMIRHERYLMEKDSKNKVLHYFTEEELYKMNPCGIFDEKKELQEKYYRRKLYRAMFFALNDLKHLNPYWYELVCEFYLQNGKITFEHLGELHGISRQAAAKSLKRAMSVLKQIAEEYFENSDD